jgi:DNA replication protein DnaC
MTPVVADVKSALTAGLTTLHLPTVRRCYEESARLAERETLSYERYLLDLVTRECQDRQHKRIQRLLRQSKIPPEKNLANFNLKRLPPKVALVTKTLLEGEFLSRRENVLAFGNPGSGKTHLLCAIGQELIGRGRRIYFTTSALLVQDLLVAKRDLKLSRFIKRLASFEGLVVDDLGYVQQSREEMEVLFTLSAERYERGSVLISSNLPFSKWEGIFKDPMTTAAAIDRLVHHCVILELNLPSYRVEQAKKAKQETPAE